MGERGAPPAQNEESRPAISRPPSLTQPCPWLVIMDGDDNCRHTFYSILKNQYYICHIPEMNNKIIITSQQQGWLFLTDCDTDDCSLFNIVTLEKIQLPQQLPPTLDPLGLHHNAILPSGIKIDDDQCRILILRMNFHKFRSCYLGDSEFVERELSSSIIAAVNYDGKLYALEVITWDLAVADLDDEQLVFTTVIEADKSLNVILKITDDTQFYLIESSGELLFVYVNCFDHDGLDVKIFRADFDKKEWVEKEEGLGDRALFLDKYKGLSTSSAASEFGLKGNCVYYVRSFEDRNLYCYDLEDRSTSVSLPSPVVSNKYSDLFWVM